MLALLEKFIEETKQYGYCNPDNEVFSLLMNKVTNATRKIMIGSELYRARVIEGDEPINILPNES